MIDGTNLNILQAGRQLLRAFGGVNETYGCSEAELSRALNFSSRGYPALQTRAPRRKTREVKDVNGMYHLNGLLLCRGTTLEYTPDADEGRSGAVVLENALTDEHKALAGMGTKVLIWPDKKAFDTETGTLTDLAAKWELGDEAMTVTPCDTEGVLYHPTGVGDTEPEKPEDGQLFLKSTDDAPYGTGSVLLKYSAKNKKWQEVLLQTVRIHCPGVGGVLKEGDTVTLSGMPQAVCDAVAAGLNGEITVGTLEEDDIIATLVPTEDTDRYYGSWTIGRTGTTWQSLDGKVTENEAASAPVTMERRVPDFDFVTEQGNRVWGCSSRENVIYACKLGDPTNWFSYRGIAADSYAVTVGSDGAFTGAATCMGYALFFKENTLHKLCGTKPSDFQLTSLRCRGVAKNAARSLCVLNETLYYLSPDGVMAWDGSIPTKVSAVLDASRLANVQSAVGGALDGRYYLHISRTAGTQGQTRLLVYDTERGLWHEEDVCSCDMASTGGQLYLWDGQALWAADPSRESDWQSTEGVEQQVSFELVTGDIGQDGAEQRYLSRLTLRLDAACASTVEVALSYDGGPWETVASLTAREARRSYDLPLVPRRHSTLRLRLRGKGQITLRSLAKNLAAAKGGLVEEQEEATWQV